MASIPRPILSKIPGGDVALPKAKETHTKDLSKLTNVELLEIKEREGKILANKSKLARLPDKGNRIQEFYNKILAEIDRRTNIDEAVALFSELNIATKGKNALNELEWTGNLKAMSDVDPTNDVIDSDDEVDPLRIIAKGTMHERKVKIVPPEASLITAEDLAEIETFNSDSGSSDTLKGENGHDRLSETTDSASETSMIDAEIIAVDVGEKLKNIKSKLETLSKNKDDDENASPLDQVDRHVRYLVTKTELQTAPPQREKFKPYKTTISDVHAPEKERTRKKGKHWEITAATPPPIQHKSTQMLPLLDSVRIQEAHLAKLKKLQEEQAAERLAAKMERLTQRNIELPATLKDNPAFTTYRSKDSIEHIEGVQRFHEDDEVHDTLDDVAHMGGGVTYAIFD